MKGCAVELEVSDWQMNAQILWACDTVKGRWGMADHRCVMLCRLRRQVWVYVCDVSDIYDLLLKWVKWVSAFGLSNDNKWRWWIRFTGCLYRRVCGWSQLAWSKGRRPPGAVSVFIAWTEWTLAMALLWWQHYKYCHGYYYYYVIIYNVVMFQGWLTCRWRSDIMTTRIIIHSSSAQTRLHDQHTDTVCLSVCLSHNNQLAAML